MKYNEAKKADFTNTTNATIASYKAAIKIAESSIKTECEKDEKLSGIVSIIDDFYQYLGKAKFLCTFDKLSNSDNAEG